MKLAWLLKKVSGDVSVMLFKGEPVMENITSYTVQDALTKFNETETEVKDFRIYRNNIMIKL